MHRMVFTQVFYWLTFLVSCCLFSSCATYRTVHIETLEPAQVHLNAQGRLVYFQRNTVYRQDSSAAPFVRTAYSLDGVEQSFGDGLNYGLAFAEPIDTAVIMTNSKRSLCSDSLAVAIEPISLSRICHKYGIGYLISLEGHFLRPEGKKGSYYWLVRAYNSDGEIVDSLLIKHPLKRNLSGGRVYLEVAQESWDNGKRYAERITPHWAQVERRVYRNADVLRVGDLFYRTGDVDEAINVWTRALEASSEISTKATINLAFLYENAGDFEGATQILKDGLQRVEKERMEEEDVVYLQEYLKTMEKRVADIEILNRQTK